MIDRPDRFHVVVVGGGIAGLATAWYLQREAAARGLRLDCVVVERDRRLGGKILTETIPTEAGPFIVEGGPDSFLAVQKPWGVELATEVGLAGRLAGTNDRERRTFVLSHGRPVRLPDGVFMLAPTKLVPFVRSRLISPLGKVRMGLEFFIPARRGDGDETLGDFVVRRFGGEALDKIAEPLLSGIYSADVGRQSLLATFPRFREMERTDRSLIKAMRAGGKRARAAKDGGHAGGPAGDTGDRSNAPAPAPGSMFVSFREGTQELVQGLLENLTCTIERGREVVAISAVPPDLSGAGVGGRRHRYLVHLAAAAERGETDQPAAPSEALEADAIVLATPAFTSADLIEALSPEAAGGLRTIRYVGTGTVSLGYREDASWFDIRKRLGGFGILVPGSEKRPVNAVTWSSIKFPGRAPSGHSLLRVFFGGSRSPRSMTLDDGELVEVVKRELRSIMGINGQPLFQRICRWEQGNPQYDVGHLERVKAVEDALPPNIWITGSAYGGIGIPDCARQAGQTAGRVMDELSRMK